MLNTCVYKFVVHIIS